MRRSDAGADGPVNRVLMVVVLLVCLPIVVLALPFVGLDALWTHFREGQAERAFRRAHGSAGRKVLIVYSRSPHSQRHIETEWLPRLQHRALTLNWSDRHEWPRRGSVEVDLYRRFAGGRDHRKQVPLALVLLSDEQRERLGSPEWPQWSLEAWLRVPRGRHPAVHVVPFWEAFRNYKHGQDQKLRAAEAELFALAED